MNTPTLTIPIPQDVLVLEQLIMQLVAQHEQFFWQLLGARTIVSDDEGDAIVQKTRFSIALENLELESSQKLSSDHPIHARLQTLYRQEKNTLFDTSTLCQTHSLLADQMAKFPGEYRRVGIGIYRGDHLIRMATSANLIANKIRQLFIQLESLQAHPLIAAGIAHFELVFTHPFLECNGIIARYWQHRLVSLAHPLFHTMNIEKRMFENEYVQYTDALNHADEKQDYFLFVKYLLRTIYDFLADLLSQAQLTNTKNAVLKTKQAVTTDDAGTKLISNTAVVYSIDQSYKFLRRLLMLYKRNSAAKLQNRQLMRSLKLKHRPTFKENYLAPALALGLLQMDQPDSPRSPTQRYLLTEDGKILLEKWSKIT